MSLEAVMILSCSGCKLCEERRISIQYIQIKCFYIFFCMFFTYFLFFLYIGILTCPFQHLPTPIVAEYPTIIPIFSSQHKPTTLCPCPFTNICAGILLPTETLQIQNAHSLGTIYRFNVQIN